MKRSIALFLALALLLALLPSIALAAGIACSDLNCAHAATDGTSHYDTLVDAVTSVASNTTVTLLKDTSGCGIINPTGHNITIDFGGHAYTVDMSPLAGSSGTQSQCFQLLKGSNVIFKNGTIKTTNQRVAVMIQNYADLTLENMLVDGTGMTRTDYQYVLSNNFGTVNLTGNTSLKANAGKVAFDVYHNNNSSYADGVTVTVNTTGAITGDIEFDHSGSSNEIAKTKAILNIVNGRFNGNFSILKAGYTPNITISGGHFTANPLPYKAAGKYVVPSSEAGYTYTMSDTDPNTAVIVKTETKATVAAALAADTTPAVQAVVAEITAASNAGDIKVEGVGGAISDAGRSSLIAAAGATVDSNTQLVEIEVTAQVKTTAVHVDESGAATSVTFEITPKAKVKVDGAAQGNEVAINDSWLNGQPITVALANPLGARLKEIVHTFEDGSGKEAFHKTGSKVFTLSDSDRIASIVITKFSPVLMSTTINNPEAAPNSSGGPSVYYKGGNSFGTSRTDMPTEVRINDSPVAFSASNGTIFVSGMPAGARWITVKWGATSTTANFVPNGVITAVAQVDLPKTGDASVMAMALCSLAAAAAVFKKR